MAPALLLLDEVTAHLDEARRHALFAEILRLECQAWMTGTDQQAFSRRSPERPNSGGSTGAFRDGALSQPACAIIPQAARD